MIFYSYEELDSTQFEAIRRLNLGEWESFCVLSHKQTGGVGTNGRTWISQEGNLHMSIATRVFYDRTPYSILAGIAAYNTLEKFGAKAKLKWPNDIFINGKKCGGILTSIEKINNSFFCIIGIGINLASYPAIETGGYIATSVLNEFGVSIAPRILAETLACNIQEMLFKPLNIMDEFNNIAFGINEPIKYLNKNYLFHGINKDGHAVISDSCNKEVCIIKSGSLDFF